jgi:hypothetical protein
MNEELVPRIVSTLFHVPDSLGCMKSTDPSHRSSSNPTNHYAAREGVTAVDRNRKGFPVMVVERKVCVTVCTPPITDGAERGPGASTHPVQPSGLPRAWYAREPGGISQTTGSKALAVLFASRHAVGTRRICRLLSAVVSRCCRMGASLGNASVPTIPIWVSSRIPCMPRVFYGRRRGAFRLAGF